ncbi:MAG: toprim domain-containing protein, partial [Candidatus Nitrosocaldus sp.]
MLLQSLTQRLPFETIANSLKAQGVKVEREKWDKGKLVEFWTQCPYPQHGDDGYDEHPSLQVALSTNGKILVHCYVCAANGIEQDEVFRYFAEAVGLSAYSTANTPTDPETFNPDSNGNLTGCCISDLAGDCYELIETFERLGIRNAEFVGKPSVAFPVTYADGSEGFHYRVAVDGKNKWRHMRGGQASQAVFGLKTLKPNADHLVITESPMDAAVLIACGFNAIAVLGCNNASALKHFRNRLPRCRTFVWCEPDAPNFAKQVAEALKRSVYALKPDAEKDAYHILKANDWDISKVAEIVLSLIAVAKEIPYETSFTPMSVANIVNSDTKEAYRWVVEGLIPAPSVIGMFGEA